MGYLTDAYLLERYGPRLNIDQLAEVLGVTAGAIRNQINGTESSIHAGFGAPVALCVALGTR